MIPSLFLALLALPQGEESAAVLVRHDLAPLSPEIDVRFSEPLVVAAGSKWALAVPLERERTGADLAVDLVRRALADELEERGRRLSQQGDGLVVIGPPALQEKVAGVLGALEAALLQTVELRVDLLVSMEEGVLPPLESVELDDGRAAELVSGAAERGASLATFQVRARPGRTTKVEAMRRIPLVREYDVEIAQGALVHEPVPGFAEEGTVLHVRAAPAQDGLSLALVLRHAEPLAGAPTERRIPTRGLLNKEAEGIGYAEAPSLYQSLAVLGRGVAFDAFLPEGKALAVEIDARLAAVGERALLVVRRTGGGLSALHEHRVEGSGRTLILANGEALLPPALGVQLAPPVDEDRSGMFGAGYRMFPAYPLARLDAVQPAFLFDWVAQRFPVWRTAGPWIAALAEPGWDPAAAEGLRALFERRVSPPRVVDLSLVLREGAGAPVALRLPVRAGGGAAAAVGVAREALATWYVEVAQLAAVADPFVVPRLDGLACAVRVGLGREGGLSLEVDAHGELSFAAEELTELGGPMGLAVDQEPASSLAVDERLSVPAGAGAQRFVLGRTGGAGALALEVGVR